MELIRGADELAHTTASWRADGWDVGLIPTMGSLHRGHVSLIERARDEVARVVVSLFVNPAQFAPGEDLATYPRDEVGDLELCRRLGVDVVWAPSEAKVSRRVVALTEPAPAPWGLRCVGGAGPGIHLGVFMFVMGLFFVVGPAAAYFGEKDAQQLFLVRRMVEQMGLPVTIVASPTVREPDGLAFSSRNARLGPEERDQAGCLFLALSEAAALARSGETTSAILVAAMAREIGATPLARLDYAAVVDEATFEPIAHVDVPARAIVAARFPSARLIDNLRLPEAAG